MDMTEGKPMILLLRFSIPLVFGNLFQQLYTFADTLIVGRKEGMYALAALGGTEWLSFLMFGLIQGMTQGFSIVVAKYYGQKTENCFSVELLLQSIYGAFFASAAAVFFTFIGQEMLYPFLKLLQTPDSLLEMSYAYLRILYFGIPISFAYNIAAAVLRAMGNSQIPLRAMLIASFSNIVLDMILVIKMELGIKGAAYGTVIAQLFAAGYCGITLGRLLQVKIVQMKSSLEKTSQKEPEAADRERINKEKQHNRKLNLQILSEQVKLGVPMGVQNVVTAVGGLTVQSVVNGFGVLFLAGYTAANKLYALLETAASSYGYGIASYTAQNVGAKQKERMKSGIAAALGIGTVTAYMMSAIMILFGKPILQLFINDSQVEIGQAVKIGYDFLWILAVFFPLLYCLYILRSCIQGMGNSIMPMLSSLIQVFMRIMCAVIVTGWIGNKGVFWGEIAAWLGADMFLVVAFLYQYRAVSAAWKVS